MKLTITILTFLLLCPFALAQNFSVHPGTFDVTGFAPPPDDILAPGSVLVLPGMSTRAVSAFSYGRTGPIGSNFYFSVDFNSLGSPGSAVDLEVISGGFGEQNADVFRTDASTMPFTNVQVHDADGMGTGGVASPLGLAEPAACLGPFQDAVDGFDVCPGPVTPWIYWSWDKFLGTPGSPSPADILISPSAPGFAMPGIPIMYAPAPALGLLAVDSIDALEVYDVGVIGTYDAGDSILFSLDPSSPSLGAFGATPGDVLIATFGGPTIIYLPVVNLGLMPGDNLTALSVPSKVPPSSYSIFRGFEISGSLADFANSDGVRARYLPGFVLNSTEAPVWLIFDANACGATSFRVESSAVTPGLTYTTEAFNWITNSYDVIGVTGESFLIDQVVDYPLFPAENIDGIGNVRSRVGWRKTGITLLYPWEVRIDQILWQ